MGPKINRPSLLLAVALAAAGCVTGFVDNYDGGMSPADSAAPRDLAMPASGDAAPDLAQSMPDLAAGGDLASCGPANRVGDSIRVACITRLDYSKTGGFRPPPPQGSTCSGEESFTLDAVSGLLQWTTCDIPPDVTKPWMKNTGQRALQPAELSSVLNALGPVKITTGAPCGADKPLETITVTTPGGTEKYMDDFYNCNGAARYYVSGIDGAFTAVRAQAHL